MSNTVLRRAGALLIAALVYCAVQTAGGQVWTHTGAGPGDVLLWSSAIATALAMLVAGRIVAKPHRLAIAWTVLLLAALPAVAVMLVLPSVGLSPVGLRALGGVGLGGLLALLVSYWTSRQ